MTQETAEKELSDRDSSDLLPILLALLLIFFTIAATTHFALGEFPDRLEGDMLAQDRADYGPNPQDGLLFLPLDTRIIEEIAGDESNLRGTPPGRPAGLLATPIPIAELPESPPSPTATPQPPPTATPAPTLTPTAIPATPTATSTPRPTATAAPTAMPTATPSPVPALLPSPTPTPLPPSPTPTPQPAGNTPTPEPPPATDTPPPSATPVPSPTPAEMPPKATPTPTATPTSAASRTPTNTPAPLASPTPSPTPSSTPTPALFLPLQPKIECVRVESDGSYTAIFGYLNVNEQTISVPIGSGNHFNPPPASRGQPTVFQHGRHHAVFSVNFDGSSLVWSLYGHSVTASSETSGCD